MIKKGDLRYHVSTFIWGFPEEVMTNVKYFFKKKTEKDNKFLIFTAGRSGSTLLLDLLNANPKIYCDDEILKRVVTNPKRIVKIHERTAPDRGLYGFKLLSYQLFNAQYFIKDKEAFFKWLVDEQGYKVIYLYRENTVLQALSIMYAMHRYQWHNQGGKVKKAEKFTLDMKRFEFSMQDLERLAGLERQMANLAEHIDVCYERDLIDLDKRQSTIRDISSFLNTETVLKETQLRKITPKTLSSFVENVDELVNYLENSPYEKYLDRLKIV